jgi:hypothetical protein
VRERGADALGRTEHERPGAVPRAE